MFEFGRLLLAEELACLMQGTPNAFTYETEFWCSSVGGLDAMFPEPP